jgi:hypothetical protein
MKTLDDWYTSEFDAESIKAPGILANPERLKAAALKAMVGALFDERQRCEDIVQAARGGRIDGDLRCLISRIRGGKPVETEDE